MSHSKRAQAQERREHLMDAALEVLARKGIDGASVKELTSAAGVTPGLLYHYFNSKEDLVTALLKERGFTSRLQDLIGQAAGCPAVDVLPELIHEYERTLADNGRLVALFFTAARSNAEARAAMERFVEAGTSLLATYLESRVEAGELRDHDSRVAAGVLFGTVALSQATGMGTDSRELVQIVLHGLVRHETPPASHQMDREGE